MDTDRIENWIDKHLLLGYALVIVILVGISVIIAVGLNLFYDYKDFYERQMELNQRCETQFPDRLNVTGGNIGNGVVWCLSISDSGVTQVGILE